MGVVSNLWNGRAGLARSFWLWGIVGGIVWKLFFGVTPLDTWTEVAAKAAYIAYFIVVLVGIWRAAFAKERGTPVLPSLARIAVVLGFAALAFIAVDVANTVSSGMQTPASQATRPFTYEEATGATGR
jgi:hypothetical protein